MTAWANSYCSIPRPEHSCEAEETMTDTYYHCAPIALSAGSIIQPGNWGRIIRQYLSSDGGTFAVGFRERILEDIRAMHYPEKPSRHPLRARPKLATAQ